MASESFSKKLKDIPSLLPEPRHSYELSLFKLYVHAWPMVLVF